MKNLGLPYKDKLQLFIRMVFNEAAKNYDDHIKNISFLINKSGEWSLSPAYDITFSYRKDSIGVNSHQMLINGKADGITVEDFMKVAQNVGIKKSDAKNSIEQVLLSVSRFDFFAEKAELSRNNVGKIKKFFSV